MFEFDDDEVDLMVGLDDMNAVGWCGRGDMGVNAKAVVDTTATHVAKKQILDGLVYILD